MGLYPAELISRIIPLLTNRRAFIRGRGALTWDFTICELNYGWLLNRGKENRTPHRDDQKVAMATYTVIAVAY